MQRIKSHAFCIAAEAGVSLADAHDKHVGMDILCIINRGFKASPLAIDFYDVSLR